MEFLLFGILLGLLSATVTESVGHKLTGHPTRFQIKLYMKYPRIFGAFLKPYYQHLVIHHHRTFKGNFFDQFRNELEKEQLDKWIEKKFSRKFMELIWVERYNLTLKGIGGTLPFAIPFMLGPILIGLTLGWAAFSASLLTAFIPVWLSKFVHPLVHLPHETADAHPFIQWLMRTKYMRHVFRNHYLHHQHLETNFNLLLGGDYLVGLHQPATKEENAILESLVAEFDRRVRLTSSDPVTASRVTAAEEGVTSISIEDFQEEERNYISLETPSFEQRFQHMKWKAKAYRDAENSGEQNILAFLNEGRTDYGMHVYQKKIDIDTWSTQEQFGADAYAKDANNIACRGLSFEVGDILLTNQSSDSDGLFSTLLHDDISFAHVAIYCLFEHNGKKLPAVVEINELGVRAVPLKVFVTERFNTYLEVLRLRSPLSDAAKSALAQAAYRMMSETHAFDIYQDASQSKYLNCARTVAELYRAIGLSPVEAKSHYHARTFTNLNFLGIQDCANKFMLMPDDFLKSSEFKLVGSIDNGNFEDVIARGLMRGRIQEIWRTKLMASSKFPLEYHVNRLVIKGIQADNWLTPILLRLSGIAKEHFPSGPVMFLSMIPTTNRLMKLGTRKIKSNFSKMGSRLLNFDSWHSLVNDDEIRTIVIDASSTFAKLYNSPEDVVSLKVNLTEPLAQNEPKQRSV